MSKIIPIALAGGLLSGLLMAPSLATAASIAGAADATTAAPAVVRPNIVYIMVDDLDSGVIPYMEEVGKLMDEGATFSNYFVATSQCCPSRGEYLTGRYPHNSEIRTNSWPEGGFGTFLQFGEADTVLNAVRSLAPPQGGQPYRTSYFGKFLNEYKTSGDTFPGGPTFGDLFIPTGFDRVLISGGNYPQWNGKFTSGGEENKSLFETSKKVEEDYLTDVLSRRASTFIETTAGRPFFMTLTPTAVHSSDADKDPQYIDDLQPGQIQPATGYPAAPRHRPFLLPWPRNWNQPNMPTTGDCGVPCNPNDMPTDPPFNTLSGPLRPAWMPSTTFDAATVEQIKADWVARLQEAQAVDEMIAQVKIDLAAAGILNDTYIVFGSDNGYHLGQHGMRAGKNTAYDHDSRLPFIIVPPGSVENPDPKTVDALVTNIDLYPTFLDIAGGGAMTDRDGRSLVPLLTGDEPADWRKTISIEFQHGAMGPEPLAAGETKAPTFHALRTVDYLYVDWSPLDDSPPSGPNLEFYRMTGSGADPAQIHNLSAQTGGPTLQQIAALNTAAGKFDDCFGASCWALGQVDPLD